jgi:lipopolysaccharide transport system ATP-binding protein
MDNLSTSYKENMSMEKKGDVVISVKNISKKFCKDLKRSMAYGIIDLSKNLLGIKADSTELRKDEFWALDNISFELRKGEALGLIGPNGSGKTTLLRMLAGIFPPDKGEIMVKGRIGALISVGAGFHPHMTGRENIYLNGSILGMTREEIDAKSQGIVDFADIGYFLDAPVSTYSSGMRVRLGFSIAMSIEPDLLLLDEILAVGDAGFRAKCYDATGELMKNAAIVFVSHNMSAINRICDSVAVMENGSLRHFSDTGEGIEHYLTSMKDSLTSKGMKHSNGQVNIDNIRLRGVDGSDEVRIGEHFEVSFEITLESEIKEAIIYIHILSRWDQSSLAFSSNIQHPLKNKGKKQFIRFAVPQLTMSPGDYSLSIVIHEVENHIQLLWYHGILPFTVEGKSCFRAPVTLLGDWEIIDKPHDL